MLIATHNSPRTWFLTQALSPLAVRLMRLLLAHGDYVVACLPPQEIEHEERSAEFRELINECKSAKSGREGWKERIRGIRCDGRSMGQCSAAVAEAVYHFQRIDILLCCKFEGEHSHSVLLYYLSILLDAYLTCVYQQLWWVRLRNSLRHRRHKTSCATSSKPSTSPKSTSLKLPCLNFGLSIQVTL